MRATGTGGDGSGFDINPVSPNERDDELIVPFTGKYLVPGVTRPQIGQLCKDIQFDPRVKVQQDKFADWVLCLIEQGSPDASLIFGRQLLPSLDLQNKPSDSHTNFEPWDWPAVLRSLSVRHIIHNGDYIDTIVVPDLVDELNGEPSEHLFEEWWTTTKWPLPFLQHSNPRPGNVRGDYPLARFNYHCLHDTQIVPSLNGVTTLNGRPCGREVHRPIIEYPATNAKTWRDVIVSDKQTKVRGRWFRQRHTVRPPFNALKYPPSPRQLSS